MSPNPRAGLGAAGVLRVFAGQVARVILSFIGLLYIAAVIGPEARGALTVLVAVSGIGGVICLWGMNGAATYMVSSQRWTGAESVILTVVWGAACAGIMSTIFWSLQLTEAGASVLGGLSVPLLCVATVGVVVYTMQSAILMGLQKYTSYSVCTVLPAALNLAAFLILKAVGVDAGHAALVAWSVCQILSALPFMLVTLLHNPGRLRLPHDTKSGLRYGTRTAISNILNLMTLRLDVLLLRPLAGAAVTGAYGVAVQFSEVTWLLPQAVGTVVFPRVAADSRPDNGEWTARVCRVAMFAVGVSSVLIAAMGSLIIYALMPAYSAGVAPLWLLVPGAVAFAIARIVGSDLFGRGLPGIHMRAAIWAITVTIGATALLIPTMGGLGAALASSLAYSVYAWRLLAGFSTTTGISAAKVLVATPSDLRETRQIVRGLIKSVRSVNASE